MAEEVLGITGAINVDDIIASFDSIINKLSSVGAKTDELSAQMSKALADIANSADKETSKTEAVMDVLKQAIAKANEEFGTMPDAIKSAQEQVDKMQQAYSRLEEQFSKTVVGSDKFNKLNTQLKNQQESLSSAKDNLNELTSAYGNAQQNISALQVLYDGLSQSVGGASAAMNAASASHAATGAAEGAATAVTTAQLAGKTVAEATTATATMNASAAAEKAALSNSVQTKSLKELKAELKEAKSEYAALLKQYEESGSGNNLNNINADIANIERKIASAQELLNSEKGKDGNEKWAEQQQEQIEGLNNQLEKLWEKYEEVAAKQNEALAPLNEYKQKIAELETQIASLGGSSFQISGKESVDELRDSLQQVCAASSEAQQGINEMSAESQKYAEQAARLKDEIELLSAAYRQASSQEIGNGGFESLEQKQAALDAIKEKIQEYGELTAQSTATAQTAYEEQVAQVKALESEYEQLSNLVTVGTSEGGAEYGAEIITRLQQLQQEITAAKERLVELQKETAKSQGKLDKVGKETTDMLAGVEKPTGIITTFKDLNKLIKEKMGQAADTVKAKASEMWNSLKDSSAGQAVGSTFDTLKSKAASAFNAIKNSSPMQYIGASIREVGGGISDMSKKVGNWLIGNGKLKESLSGITTSLEGMGIPIKSVQTGISGITSRATGLLKVPIFAAFSAIVLVFQAFYTWLNKSSEGQRVMVKISAVLSSVMSTLTDVVVILGDKLYKSLDVKPVKALALALGNVLVNAIKTLADAASGLSDIFKGIQEGDWSSVTKGWEKIKQAGGDLVDFGASVLDALEKAPDAIKSIGNAISDTLSDDKTMNKLKDKVSNLGKITQEDKRIADEYKQTELDIANAKEKEAEQDILIAKKREEIYKLTGAAKDKTIEETKELLKQKYQPQIEGLQKQKALLKEKHKLHTMSLEDYAAERNANIAILRLQGQQAASTRMLTRMQESNRRSMASKSSSAANKDKNQQNAITAADDKYDETVVKNTQARINAELKLEQDVEEARIAAIADAGEREREERAYQHKKDMQQLAQQRDAAIQAEKDRQKAEFDAQQAIVKAQGGKIESFDWEKHGDKTATDKISAQYQVIGDYKEQSFTQEKRKQELESMRNYLKEYGTIQQQRVALIEEWNEKIEKAQSEAERQTARQQKAQAVEDFDNEQLKNSVNWNALFGDIGNMSVERLQSAKTTLKEMLSNKDLEVDDYKTIVEQINKVSEALVEAQSKQGLFFSFTTESAKERKKLENEVADAIERQNVARSQVAGAQLNLDFAQGDIKREAQKYGIRVGDKEAGSIDYSDAETAIDEATAKYGENSDAVRTLKSLFDKLADSTRDLVRAQKKLTNADQDVNDTKDKQKTNKKKTINEKVGEWAETYSKYDEYLQGAVEVTNALGLGDSGFGKTLSGVAEASTNALGAMESFASGDYLGALAKGIGSIKSLGSAFGIGGGNAAETAKKIEALTESNGYLKTSIDKLTEAMEDSNGTEAVNNYEKAVAAQKKSTENYGEILNARMHYHNSHHSNAYYWDLDDDMLKQVETLTGKSLGNSWGSFYNNLSAEDFDAIRTYLPDVWQEMINQGKYGDRFKEDWENYADQAGKVDELTDKINEKLTGMTFDSLFDNFVSSLMDMDATAKDWADDISEYFAKSMLQFQLSDLLEDDMKEWYQSWSDIMKDQGGKLTESQIAQMQSEQREWYQKAEDLRDNVFTITGYDEVAESSQSSTTGSYDGITQDQGSEISGRLTAVQWNGEQRLQYAIQQTALMTTVQLDTTQMRITQETIRGYVSELVDIQQDSLSNLQKIVVNTSPLPEMKTVLDDIYKKIKNL